MKISGFTFLRNAEMLGFPYLESIQSILPICDEFVIALGKSQDVTKKKLQDFASIEPKLKIIETEWNDHIQIKGYVYGQQKMIAQYACTGDWLFYLEGDEIVHEQDLNNIKKAMCEYKDNPDVEALVFHYFHFYGNTNTCISSPHWYRFAPRIIKANIRSYAPDGLYWLVLDSKKSNRTGRYPKAKLLQNHIYHYGWVRTESAMREKINQVNKYWGKSDGFEQSYRDVDSKILIKFLGNHPKVIYNFFPKEQGIFKANPNYKITTKEKIYRVKSKLEQLFGIDLSRKHFTRVR